MNKYHQPTQEECQNWFKLLEKELATTLLSTENGGTRKADASEFMLMDCSEDEGRFKHRDTRNYLMVFKTGGDITTLVVPKTSHAFMRGYFDWHDYAA